jgi:hypothetical protein
MDRIHNILNRKIYKLGIINVLSEICVENKIYHVMLIIIITIHLE